MVSGTTTDEATAVPATAPSRSGRLWQNLWVRLSVALAFADASIVVIALPQIVARLHTSISHSTWVITAYNLALIVTSAAIIPVASHFASRRALVVGLALFGLASLGCGAANSLSVLIPCRVVQGAGGAVLLCASLPLFAGAARSGDSPLNGWSAAAAIGMAVGPAAGGVLTQVFDWRSIFFFQAPVAAVAAIAVLAGRGRSPKDVIGEVDRRASALDPLSANVALTLLSSGLITALFLSVIVLINVWLLTPIAAAAIVSMIPVATAIAERAVRGSSPVVLGAVGAVLVAVGLIGLALVSHREVGWVLVTLALVGTGLGLAFPGLTTAALGSSGSATARAAKTVAARDAGIVLGLLTLTPIFVNQLNAAPNRAIPHVAKALFAAPIPAATRTKLIPGLQAAYHRAPQSELPNLRPPFEQVSANAPAEKKVQLLLLRRSLDAIIQRAATHAFKKPLIYGAIFALLVLPIIGLRLAYLRQRKAGVRMVGAR